MRSQRGELFVISGASGVGKSTVIARVLEDRDNLYFSVSCTTRPARPGEVDAVNYHFIKQDEFEKKIANNEFLEYAEYVGNYYGTSSALIEEKLEKGIDVILDIEVQGAIQVKGRRPDAVLIFIIPPSFEELERRLRVRNTDHPGKIAGRLKRAREEYQEIARYDYIVVNDIVEEAAEEIGAILIAEHCRTKRRFYLTEGV